MTLEFGQVYPLLAQVTQFYNCYDKVYVYHGALITNGVLKKIGGEKWVKCNVIGRPATRGSSETTKS